ncbi:hypothetical protein CBR56_06790 [Bacillus thuringiensis]|nr:hypothetical protein BK728_11730 [Bacillus thuringiensis serovar chanpaisis]PNK31595.1 hypothetical protein CBR56_06790 [Bacillus thuringiensis]
MGVFSDIAAQLEIYQRFSKYIGRNSKYISDFPNISVVTRNISAIFKIYRLTDKTRQSTQKERGCLYGSPPYF